MVGLAALSGLNFFLCRGPRHLWGGSGMRLNIFFLLPVLEAFDASGFYEVPMPAHRLPPWISNINHHLFIKGHVLCRILCSYVLFIIPKK